MSVSTPPATPAPVEEQPRVTVGTLVSDYVAKIRGGDVGSLPAILGLVVLVIVFTILKPQSFANPFNFANLINQASAVVVIAMGLVFVLLLGEIDLSAGYTAGTCAAVMAILLTNHDVNWLVSILGGIATGAVIGAVIGLLVARLGIPSFVVTLALFLGLQGMMLVLIGEGGSIGVRDNKIIAIMNDNLPVWLGWTITVVGVGGYAALTFLSTSSRRAKGLHADPPLLWAIKTGTLAVIAVAFTAYLSQERSRKVAVASVKGVPIVVLVLLGLLVVLTFMLTRTSWGRHIYAVGGNAEAARRAGINVANIRLTAFMTCSMLAAIAGVLLASRNNGVQPNTGGASTLLYAVGAAVIGGTSLFGGKGRVLDAIVGGFVVAVIDNGMLLLQRPQGQVFIVTGVVLLLAASVDAISRRRAQASGRV